VHRELGPLVDAALTLYPQAVWHDTEAAVRERYAELEDAVRARIAEQVAAEREQNARFREALEVVARSFSSDWPAPCKHSVLAARQALSWVLGA
jgi:hypothetical protein